MHMRRVLCYTSSTNAAHIAALPVFRYTGFVLSTQTETGKPRLTFFFLSAIIVLYRFLIPLYDERGPPPA